MHTSSTFLSAAAVSLLSGVVQCTPTDLRDAPNIVLRAHTIDDVPEHLYKRNASASTSIVVKTAATDQQNLYVYIDGLVGGQQKFLHKDGDFRVPARGAAIPSTPLFAMEDFALDWADPSENTFVLPEAVESGRVWISEKNLEFQLTDQGKLVQPSISNPTDPAINVSFGFIEFDTTGSGFLVNPSFVDWVGLVYDVEVAADNQTYGPTGLKVGAREEVCNKLKEQAKADGKGWGELCVYDDADKLLRVISPNSYAVMRPDSWTTDYWNDYINKVWDRYSGQPLNIFTQDSGGVKNVTGGIKVGCQVGDGALKCTPPDGQPQFTFQKPTSADIWGCNSGPFVVTDSMSTTEKEVLTRLCVAFTRSTLLLAGGETTPSLDRTNHYPVSGATNFYSKFVHESAIDGQTYAFAYDDVNVGDENNAGVLLTQTTDDVKLTVNVHFQ